MRLNNFFKLVADIDSSYKIYFKQEKNGPKKSIFKITLSSSECLFLAGTKPAKNISNCFKIIQNIQNKDIPLLIQLDNKKYEFYGVQIDPMNRAIYLF